MDVNLIFKVAAIGIIVAILHTLLKQSGKEDFGFSVTLVGVIVVLVMLIQLISQLFETVRTMFQL